MCVYTNHLYKHTRIYSHSPYSVCGYNQSSCYIHFQLSILTSNAGSIVSFFFLCTLNEHHKEHLHSINNILFLSY